MNRNFHHCLHASFFDVEIRLENTFFCKSVRFCATVEEMLVICRSSKKSCRATSGFGASPHSCCASSHVCTFLSSTLRVSSFIFRIVLLIHQRYVNLVSSFLISFRSQESSWPVENGPTQVARNSVVLFAPGQIMLQVLRLLVPSAFGQQQAQQSGQAGS